MTNRSPSAPLDDAALLQRFEPVIRYTQGELFLPCSVEDYVARAALLGRAPGVDDYVELAAPGELSPHALPEVSNRYRDWRLALRFVDRPLDRKAYRRWARSADRPEFVASSRFATVGLVSRIIDSVMRLTLLVRGRVPKGYAAAAHLRIAETAARADHPYYGRVVRDGGYTVLQYWFFYAMNDWRSTFGGVNDHEGDWEQVTLFLRGQGDDVDLAWIAFSSHDEVGDDLRRRPDDPDITWVDGTHPVVHAGAGSHSGAYLAGEYVLDVGLPLPHFITAVWERVLVILPWSKGATNAISIPYIDYRRGDGASIGPEQDIPWRTVVINDTTPWVSGYAGLWGLDTKDPLGGERAPAGPRFDRDGSIRRSWSQPVAWAGLDKVADTDEQQGADDRVAVAALEQELVGTRQTLQQARAELRGASHLAASSPGPTAASWRSELQSRVDQLRHREAVLLDRKDRLEHIEATPPSVPNPHAHLAKRAMPLATSGRASSPRLLRTWSAVSASVLLGAAGIILLWGRGPIAVPLLTLALVMLAVEAAVRGRLVKFAVNAAAALVVVIVLATVVFLVLSNLRFAVGALLLVGGVYILMQTIGEGLGMRASRKQLQ